MNKYLEKVANALTRAISKGLVTSVSTVARDGSRLGASALNRTLTGASPTGIIRSPSVRNAIGDLGRVKGLKLTNTPARDVISGDALARSSIKSRLAASKADIASGKVKVAPSKSVFGNSIRTSASNSGSITPQGGKNDFLSRAKSFIEANPKTSVGLGVAGAGVLGQAIGKKRGENQFQQY